MFKNLKLALVLGAALTLLSPSVALAERHERYERHHRGHVSVYFGYGPRHYGYGYYDGWGYWHPYGYYRYYGYPW